MSALSIQAHRLSFCCVRLLLIFLSCDNGLVVFVVELGALEDEITQEESEELPGESDEQAAADHAEPSAFAKRAAHTSQPHIGHSCSGSVSVCVCVCVCVQLIF